MEREMPAGLSEAQRWVLCEFFKGHISAGRLTQRLGLDAHPRTRSSSSERQPRVREMESEASAGRAARIADTPRRRLPVIGAAEGLLRLSPRRTHI